MMTRISFVFCLCAVVLACGCGSRSGLSDAKKGMQAFKAGRYEAAIALFSAAAERIPNSPELYYHLGLAHLEHGNIDLAQEALQVALNLNPVENEANILGALAQTAYHQKDFAGALAALRRALEVSLDDATAVRLLTTMGAVYAAGNEYNLAHLCYLRALKLDRSYVPAYYNCSVLYQDQYSLREEALDSLGMFSHLTDKKHKKRDNVENRVKRLRKNIDRFARPVHGDAEIAAGFLHEGVNAYIAKQYPKAIKAYKDALAADPLTFSAALGLGEVYTKQGLRAEALEAFNSAIEINPTHQECYLKAAELALQLKQPAEASRLLTKAIARSPYNAESSRLMAQAAHAEANIPEAIAYGEFYLSLIPEKASGREPFEKWVQQLKKK